MMTKEIEGSFPEDSYQCDSCKHDPEPWDSEACDVCCKAHSGYEPKDSSTDSSTVSLAVFEQVKWERDVAIQQLEELGYGLGEKIRTDEDCISREELLLYLDTLKEFEPKHYGFILSLQRYLRELTPVKPKERTGEWINITNQDLHDCRTGNRLCFECPKCKSRSTYRSNYCPNCGCRLNEEVRE